MPEERGNGRKKEKSERRSLEVKKENMLHEVRGKLRFLQTVGDDYPDTIRKRRMKFYVFSLINIITFSIVYGLNPR